MLLIKASIIYVHKLYNCKIQCILSKINEIKNVRNNNIYAFPMRIIQVYYFFLTLLKFEYQTNLL